jgi:hypothetical protein
VDTAQAEGGSADEDGHLTPEEAEQGIGQENKKEKGRRREFPHVPTCLRIPFSPVKAPITANDRPSGGTRMADMVKNVD